VPLEVEATARPGRAELPPAVDEDVAHAARA
jgi:hypothetical protein